MTPMTPANRAADTPFTDQSFWGSLYPRNRYRERTEFALNFLLSQNQPVHTVLSYIDTLIAKYPERLTQKDPENHNLTPLHIAVMKANSQAVKKILSTAKDAKTTKKMLNERDAFGYTPLHMAALTSEVLYREFLEAGANPTLKNLKGGTPDDLYSLTGRVSVIRSKETLFFDDPQAQTVKKVALLNDLERAKLFPVGFIHTDTPLYRPNMFHRLWLDNAAENFTDTAAVTRFESKPPHLVIRKCKEMQGDDKSFELASVNTINKGAIISEYSGLRSELKLPSGFRDAYAKVSALNAYATERFDAELVGNESRFSNCGFPNALIQTFPYKGSNHSYLVATKDIEPGEAILWDYGITMTHLVFGRQTLFNKEQMLQFYSHKSSAQWAKQLQQEIAFCQTIKDPKVQGKRSHEIASYHENYFFALNNPTALLYLFFNGVVDLDLWMNKKTGNFLMQQYRQKYAFEMLLLHCIFKTLKKTDEETKNCLPEVKKHFCAWVLTHLEKIPLVNLLKGIEYILDKSLKSFDDTSIIRLLQETDQFLRTYDWQADPEYPFNVDRRARLLLEEMQYESAENKITFLLATLERLKRTLGEECEATETYQVPLRALHFLHEQSLDETNW